MTPAVIFYLRLCPSVCGEKPPVEYSHGKLEAIYKELTEKEEQEKETKAEGTQKTGAGEETVQPVNLI